jgi:hypothetical protein
MNLMPKLKILFIVFILLFSYLLIKPTFTLADASLSQEQFENIISNGSYTKEDADFATLGNTVNTVNVGVGGPTTPELSKIEGPGAIAQISGLVGGMIDNPPVSSKEYLADLGSSLGIISAKPAYAQGIGWQALAPVLPVWKAFRNLTYLAFVIVFVVIGFMIIFRAKINPQTVISIQAALPNIVVTLLLVTFSYAIAGLMIDLIYIALYLLVGVFEMGGLIIQGESGKVINIFLTQNPFGLIHWGAEGMNWSSLILKAPAEAIQKLIAGVGGIETQAQKLNVIGGIVKLILSIAVLFSMFRLFFSLILSYLAIVLSVIFAPLNLLFNAIPGNDAFMSWLKNLFANVIVFPAVAGLFLIAAVLIGPEDASQPCGDQNGHNPWCIKQGVGYYQQAAGEGVWIPPLLNFPGAQTNNFQGLIALGMIMMSPQVVSMIKKILKVEGGGFGGTIVAGIMAGPKMVAAVPQTGYDLAMKAGYLGVGPMAGKIHPGVTHPTGEAAH